MSTTTILPATQLFHTWVEGKISRLEALDQAAKDGYHETLLPMIEKWEADKAAILSTLIADLLPALHAVGIKRLHVFTDTEPSFAIEAADGTEVQFFRKSFDETLAALRAKQQERTELETLY